MKDIYKVVLVGGTGFIGNYLSENFAKKEVNLSVISKNPPLKNKLSNINYYQVDDINNGKGLGKILNNTDCVVLLHQPEKKVIENLIKFSSGIKKIVYTSSILLYEDSPTPLKEDSKLNPINEYDKKKFEEENMLSEFAKKQDIILTIARLSNVYGNIKNRGIVQRIFNALLNNEEFIINGDGNQIRDYIFVEDVASYLEDLTLLSADKSIDTFNICSSTGYSINELISLIEGVTGKKLSCQNGPAIKEKSSLVGDNGKIIKFTRKKPAFTLEEGLKKTYQNNLGSIN